MTMRTAVWVVAGLLGLLALVGCRNEVKPVEEHAGAVGQKGASKAKPKAPPTIMGQDGKGLGKKVPAPLEREGKPSGTRASEDPEPIPDDKPSKTRASEDPEPIPDDKPSKTRASEDPEPIPDDKPLYGAKHL